MRFLAVLCLSLAACAGAVPGNPQGRAGITDIKLEWQDGYLTEVRWIDGKEKQTVVLSADLHKGTLTYSATAVQAFQGFETRSQVENFVAEKFASAAPDLRVGLVDLFVKILGL